jgi:GTP cyclohydrolase I
MTKPSRIEAENAIRTLLEWIGDDPTREGLQDTPSRVATAYQEYFGGYSHDPATYLTKTFEDVQGYDEDVILRDIPLQSFCEHHMAPFIGVAHIAYKPYKKVVGISKIARVVDTFAKRLQIQEKLTSQIAEAIDTHLKPLGCLVIIEATHHCMTMRGVQKQGMVMLTHKSTGVYAEEDALRQSLISMMIRKV